MPHHYPGETVEGRLMTGGLHLVARADRRRRLRTEPGATRCLVALLALGALSVHSLPTRAAPGADAGARALNRGHERAPDPERERRLAWFRRAKFGLFIHWGLYAIPAGSWKGVDYPFIGEWIMRWARIP